MKKMHFCGAFLFLALFVTSGAAQGLKRDGLNFNILSPAPPPAGGTWSPLNHQPGVSLSVPLLLHDGTVICQGVESASWYRLTPDSFGSYVNGTWSSIASLPSGYAPLYYASAVLPDGRVFIMGGEYNVSGGGVWTNKGAIYDPVANTWTGVAAPAGWSQIGDAQCVVLQNGTLMIADPFNAQSALLDPTTLTWTVLPGAGKGTGNDEEGWTLMRDGTVVTFSNVGEKFIPATNSWMTTGAMPFSLVSASGGEVGPGMLLPDGRLFAIGGNPHSALYTPGATTTSPGSWVAGPDLPTISGSAYDVADGPCAFLPNGNVLTFASPGLFLAGARFFEFNPTASTWTEVANTPNGPTDTSFYGEMLVLPTGQVLFTDFSGNVQVYTPVAGTTDAWRPTIVDWNTVNFRASGNTLVGTQLNGLNCGSSYGDDSTNATNYPMVRITNLASGHVFYTKTSNYSTMAVQTGTTPELTSYAVPAGIELGQSSLEVVTNGIPSFTKPVTIVDHLDIKNATTFLQYIGTTVSGNVGGAANSGDGSVIISSPSYAVARGVPNIGDEFTFTVPSTVNTLSLNIDCVATASAVPVTEAFYLYDWSTSSFVQVGSLPMVAGAPTAAHFPVLLPAVQISHFVSSTGQIRARVGYFDTTNHLARWTVSLDLFDIEQGY